MYFYNYKRNYKSLFEAIYSIICLCLRKFIIVSIIFIFSSETHAGVIFVDGFETGELKEPWHIGESKAFQLNYNPRYVHSGKASMQATAMPGKGAGGMARIFFEPGYHKIHVRWYCVFERDFDQGNLMHLNKLVASKEKWAATAGTRPSGLDFFRTTLDLWRDWGKNPPPGEPVFYSYFPGMKKDRKTGKYWGNFFKPKRKVFIRPGGWYCMEMMLKANFLPTINNGEQAFWINGKLIGWFKGITWRYTNDLLINSFLIGLYVHDNPKINRVWYDDIVVSTEYIGP